MISGPLPDPGRDWTSEFVMMAIGRHCLHGMKDVQLCLQSSRETDH